MFLASFHITVFINYVRLNCRIKFYLKTNNAFFFCYFTLLLIFTKNYFIIIVLLYFFFHENYFYFCMFQDVPAFSGMFRVPGFIDGLEKV